MYDLIIVGGGPSGSTAARRAGTLGLTTLLVEKETFPRYKACAGALSQRAISYLDFDLPESIREGDVFGVRVHFGKHVIERHKEYRLSTLVTRSAFDNHLLEKAVETGIDVKTGERVLDIEEQPDGVEIQTTVNAYRARFAIVAEGAHGRLRNRIRRRDTKDEYALAVVTETEAENARIDRDIGNAIDIHFGVADFGYGWIFPHRDHFSVGIAGLASRLTRPRATMADFLRANGFDGTYNLHAHVLPAGGVDRDLVGSRTILTGDAAGFVDPVYGEGLAYAIRSGQIAAEVVAQVVPEEKEALLLKEYKSICENEFGADLRYALMLSGIIQQSPGTLAKLLATDEDVLDTFLDVAGGNTTYSEFVSWLAPKVPSLVAHQPCQARAGSTCRDSGADRAVQEAET